MSTPRADTRLLFGGVSPAFVSAAVRDGTDITATLSADDASSTTLMPAGPVVGSYMAFGSAAPFNALAIEITTQGIATWTIAWQYWDGSAWQSLPSVADGTTGLTAAAGVRFVTFLAPTDWASTTLASLDAYYIRAYVSALTSMTTNPQADYAVAYTIVDSSQWSSSLIASPEAFYEDPSARAALDGTAPGRTLVASIELDTSMSGTLISFGADLAANPAYEITVSGGDVFAYQNGTAVLEETAPNVDGTAKTYIVAWATEPNPATTGASDALRSEFSIYDVDGAELLWTTADHAVVSAGSTGALSIGGEWDGSTMTNVFDGTINEVAILARFATRTEIRERFVAQTSAPSVDGITAVEAPVLPSQITEAGALAGPAYQAAAASMAVGRNRHRLASPLIQMITPSAPWIPLDPRTGWPDTWVITLSDGFHTGLGWLWRRRVPTHLGWLRASVHWAARDTGASAVDCDLRIYCSDRHPGIAQQWSSATLTRTTDDDAGLGAFEDFDLLRVRRDADGYSWIWLAGYTEGTNNEYRVRGLTVVPVSKAAQNNAPPNQWGP